MTPLRNFHVEVGPVQPARQVITTTTESRVVLNGNNRHTYRFKTSDAEWDTDAFQDYVVDQIERIHGVFPRDMRKESAIFGRFMKQFGSNAPKIARYAFEVCNGRWAGAPIAVQRFSKGSDNFFAIPILNQLQDR